MITIEDIIKFIKEESLAKSINPDTDIFMDLGIVGDDFDELIEKYSKKYSVDMKNYLWYFHCDEEGQGLLNLVSPPHERVKRIPITPKLLTDFANSNKWNMTYPEHKLPKYRWDIIFNQILLIGLIVCLTIYLWNKFFG